MANTFTPLLRLRKQATASNTGVWGSSWNSGVTSLFDTSIAGVSDIDLTPGMFTLTPAYGVADNTRAAILRITNATAPGVLVVPATTKLYLVSNQSARAVIVKTAFDAGVTIIAASKTYLLVDGVNLKVRDIGFGDVYPIGENSVGAIVPVNGSVITTAAIVYKENALATLYLYPYAAVITTQDWVIPVFDTLPTTYQPTMPVGISASVLDGATVRAVNFNIDRVGYGTSVRISRQDGGLFTGGSLRTLAIGVSMTYPLIGA